MQQSELRAQKREYGSCHNHMGLLVGTISVDGHWIYLSFYNEQMFSTNGSLYWTFVMTSCKGITNVQIQKDLHSCGL